MIKIQVLISIIISLYILYKYRSLGACQVYKTPFHLLQAIPSEDVVELFDIDEYEEFFIEETPLSSISTTAPMQIHQQKPLTLSDLKKSHSNEIRSKNLPIVVGKDMSTGDIVIEDLAKMPHLLVGGATGRGKSNMMNTIIDTLDGCATMVDLILFDPSDVEFYKHRKREKVTLMKDDREFLEELLSVRVEMERRKELFQNIEVVNIEAHNNESKDFLAYKVIVIDEFAQIFDNEEIRKELSCIARLGRKFGIHLILGTQRPDSKIIDAQIRANIPVSIALGVRDKGNARVLNAPGAELLKKPGLAIFAGSELLKVRTPLED